MWAVVPVKDMSGAKQRLAPVLASDERQEFYRAMLEDALSAVAQVSELTGISLVTKDREAIELGRRYNIRIIGETENRGHSAASQNSSRHKRNSAGLRPIKPPTPADFAVLA